VKALKNIGLAVAVIPFLVIWCIGWIVGTGHKAFSKGHETGYESFMPK